MKKKSNKLNYKWTPEKGWHGEAGELAKILFELYEPELMNYLYKKSKDGGDK